MWRLLNLQSGWEQFGQKGCFGERLHCPNTHLWLHIVHHLWRSLYCFVLLPGRRFCIENDVTLLLIYKIVINDISKEAKNFVFGSSFYVWRKQCVPTETSDSLSFVFRVFSSVIFAAMNVGQSASLAPDYGKAKVSAQRIFHLLDRKPQIDSYSEEGEKLVRFFQKILELRY